MSMRAVIEGIEREMLKRTAERNCGNCKYWDDFSGVCCNGDSEERADFTDGDFYCECHEFKGVNR